jgi:hypothetical protein
LLNQVISEVTFDGKKRRTFVIANNGTIARQVVDEDGTQKVSFDYTDASGMSLRNTNDSGSAELDPLGNNVGLHATYTSQPRGDSPPSPFDQSVATTGSQCTMDGISGPCNVVEALTTDTKYPGAYGTFFSINWGLPFEAKGRTPHNPNNPLAIGNEIRRQLDAQYLDTRPHHGEVSDSYWNLNYDPQYLNYLLGNPTQGQTGQQDDKNKEQQDDKNKRKKPGPKTKEFCKIWEPLIDWSRGALNAFWKLSEYGTDNAHEVGGLMGYATAPFIESSPIHNPGKPTDDFDANIRVTGLPAFAEKMKNEMPNIHWIFYIHTHPFDTGQKILVKGNHEKNGQWVTAGDVNYPSTGPNSDLSNLPTGFIGIILTKSSIVLYTKEGRRCRFNRYD